VHSANLLEQRRIVTLVWSLLGIDLASLPKKFLAILCDSFLMLASLKSGIKFILSTTLSLS
jgi:hypothetical protein